MDEILAFALSSLRYILAGLALVIAVMCAARLAQRRKFAPQETFLLSAVSRDRFPLERCENAVGRSPRCDVVLNLPTISRFHAVIALRKDGWTLFDTGSQGGTKVEGNPLQKRAALTHGQHITFGSMEFIFFDPAVEREQEELIRRQDSGFRNQDRRMK